MKTSRIIVSTALFLVAFAIQSCQKSEMQPSADYGILPSKFKVDIPSSLTASYTTQKSASALKSTNADTLQGNDIYRNLNTFIAVGDGASGIIEGIIGAIVIYRINKPMVISYQSNDDQRTKNLVVKENGIYNGKVYKYMLTITDAASEGNADGGKALQIFWNPSPIEGIAILKPYNIDRVKNANAVNALFRIEYSEVGTADYDSYMVVDIANLPMADPSVDQFSMKTLKMFVGKRGDYVDVYGNSDHPNAKFFTNQTGFNWAFVASGVDNQNFGVAEVGLPPSVLDDSTRKVLLEDYSIKNVFTSQINTWFYNAYGFHPDSTDLSNYLRNADAPGFFDSKGFVTAGTAPDIKYAPLVSRIGNLIPYNPKEISNLTIDFE